MIIQHKLSVKLEMRTKRTGQTKTENGFRFPFFRFSVLAAWDLAILRASQQTLCRTKNVGKCFPSERITIEADVCTKGACSAFL